MIFNEHSSDATEGEEDNKDEMREEGRDWAEAAAYFQADVRGRGGARRGRLLDN